MRKNVLYPPPIECVVHHFRCTWLLFPLVLLGSCTMLRQSAKYKFNDGIYNKGIISDRQVYVLNVDEDTIAVFPVKQFKDSTAIITTERTVFTSRQRKLRDNKATHSFYKPSFDIDAMTIPLKYRPATPQLPNQLTNNFNGALYAGYRIDAYKLHYKRTPLNVYKQHVRHLGYSAGLFAGFGNSLINEWTLPNRNLEYEGMLLLTGAGINIAVENLTFGLSVGTDHLMDNNHKDWIYQGKPWVGFTVGLNIN